MGNDVKLTVERSVCHYSHIDIHYIFIVNFLCSKSLCSFFLLTVRNILTGHPLLQHRLVKVSIQKITKIPEQQTHDNKFRRFLELAESYLRGSHLSWKTWKIIDSCAKHRK